MAHPVFSVTPIGGVVPLTVTAHLHDTDGDSSLGTVTWDWGDVTSEGTGFDATHTYTTPGSYNLTGISSEGEFTQTVTIVAYEAPPVAVNDSFQVVKNSSLSATVASNDAAGPNLAAALWTVNTPPMHGTIDVWPGNGSFTYTPTTDYTGPDSFTYTLTNTTTNFSSDATVTLNVGNGAPSIKAWFNGGQVLLGLAENQLVFDGFQFVPPDQAKQVAIVETTSVTGAYPPIWPESQSLVQANLTWTNVWLCRVIGIDQTSISDSDVVTITDPNNGVCVCGISCNGVQIQYIAVINAS